MSRPQKRARDLPARRFPPDGALLLDRGDPVFRDFDELLDGYEMSAAGGYRARIHINDNEEASVFDDHFEHALNFQ